MFVDYEEGMKENEWRMKGKKEKGKDADVEWKEKMGNEKYSEWEWKV